MGMFDNIQYKGRPYQTKDTPLQTLDNYKIEQDQEEYEALFMDGRMLKIKLTRGEPLTEWLIKGIEEKGLE